MHDPTESAQEGCVRKTWNVCTETTMDAGVKMLNSVDHITSENMKNERRARFTKAVELDGKLDDFLQRLRLTCGIDTEDQILKIFCPEDKKHEVEKALQIELQDITENLHPFVEVVTTTTTAFSFERNKGEIAEKKLEERLLSILVGNGSAQQSKDYVQEPSHEPGRLRDRLAVLMLLFAIVVLMIVVEVWLMTMIFPSLAPMLNHIVGARQSAMLIPIEDEGSLGNPSRDLSGLHSIGITENEYGHLKNERTLIEILKDGRDSRGEQEHLKDCLQDKYEPLCNFRGMWFKFDEDFSQALIELLRKEGEFEALNVIGLVRNESLDLWIRKSILMKLYSVTRWLSEGKMAMDDKYDNLRALAMCYDHKSLRNFYPSPITFTRQRCQSIEDSFQLQKRIFDDIEISLNRLKGRFHMDAFNPSFIDYLILKDIVSKRFQEEISAGLMERFNDLQFIINTAIPSFTNYLILPSKVTESFQEVISTNQMKRYGQGVVWKIIFSGRYHYYWSIDTVLPEGWMHPDMERWLVKEVNTCNVMASVLNVNLDTSAPDEVFNKSLQATCSGTLALVGRSGSGKTSIMAELMRQYVNKVGSRLSVHAHFIGDAPGSTHVLPLVQRLCLVMCRCSTNVPDESKYLWDYRKLVQVFSEMLTAAATHVRSYFMLVLEALDRGKDAHKAQATMGLQPSPTVENWNIEKRLQIGEVVFRK